VRRTPHPTVQLVRRNSARSRATQGRHGTGFVDLATMDLSNMAKADGAGGGAAAHEDRGD